MSNLFEFYKAYTIERFKFFVEEEISTPNFFASEFNFELIPPLSFII